jgi:hypothetical protein
VIERLAITMAIVEIAIERDQDRQMLGLQKIGEQEAILGGVVAVGLRRLAEEALDLRRHGLVEVHGLAVEIQEIHHASAPCRLLDPDRPGIADLGQEADELRGLGRALAQGREAPHQGQEPVRLVEIQIEAQQISA